MTLCEKAACIYMGGDPGESGGGGGPSRFYNISLAHITKGDHRRADLSSSLKKKKNITIYLFYLLVPKLNQDVVWSKSVNIQTHGLCTD